MQQIEEDKPDGWGLKKIKAEDIHDAEEMDEYFKNFNHALKKMDIQHKIDEGKK